MGYGEFQIKILVPQSGTRPGCKAMELTGPPLIGTVAGLSATEFVITEDYNPSFCSAQENVSKFWNCRSPTPAPCPQRIGAELPRHDRQVKFERGATGSVGVVNKPGIEEHANRIGGKFR